MKKKTVFRLLHTDNGRYAISFILGLGLASLFKKVCSDRNCIVLAAPPFEEVTKNIYEYNNKCYKFDFIEPWGPYVINICDCKFIAKRYLCLRLSRNL